MKGFLIPTQDNKEKVQYTTVACQILIANNYGLLDL